MYLVTSALPYVNNVPHLGNIVGSVLSGDVYARFLRNNDSNVIYLCGTDDYGTTTEIKARQEGMTNQEICQKYHMIHKEIYDWFNIQFDIWGKTSTATQTQLTQSIFHELFNNGYIEERVLRQAYCSTCDLTLADRYIKGICYTQECHEVGVITNGDQCDSCNKLIDVDRLISPQCSLCGTTPIFRDSPHLFLKLAELQEDVKKYFDSVELSQNARAILKTWLQVGFKSRCITRDLNWGTPVPHHLDPTLEKYAGKVFYNWFDAPIGYLSILKSAGVKENEISNWVQFMAKDNVPFHTIMFPATLLAANHKLIVTNLNATEYLLYNGQKFSKSKGIGVFGDQVRSISEKLGIHEDYWRYYLMRIRPEGADSSFEWEHMTLTCTADLVNNYGNFVNRCISFSKKRFASNRLTLQLGCFPEYETKISDTRSTYHQQMTSKKVRNGLTAAISVSAIGNEFLQTMQPWKLAANDIQKLNDIMAFGLWIAREVSELLLPFIPRSAEYVMNYIQFEKESKTIILSNESYVLPFRPIKYKEIEEQLQSMGIVK